MPKVSAKRQLEMFARAIFSVYVMEHGGVNNQAYLYMLWTSGRLEELTELFLQHEKRLMPKETKT